MSVGETLSFELIDLFASCLCVPSSLPLAVPSSDAKNRTRSKKEGVAHATKPCAPLTTRATLSLFSVETFSVFSFFLEGFEMFLLFFASPPPSTAEITERRNRASEAGKSTGNSESHSHHPWFSAKESRTAESNCSTTDALTKDSGRRTPFFLFSISLPSRLLKYASQSSTPMRLACSTVIIPLA